jgi:salicylate hydroxylase
MRRYGFAAVKASDRALQQSVIVNPMAFAASKTMLRMINTAMKAKKRISA